VSLCNIIIVLKQNWNHRSVHSLSGDEQTSRELLSLVFSNLSMVQKTETACKIQQ